MSTSSLLLVADLDGALQRYLRSQVPASAEWNVQSCSSAEAAVGLPPGEVPNLVVVVCGKDDAMLCFNLLRLLEYAKRHWPYTFFILAGKGPLQNLDELFGYFGEMPVVDLNAGAELGGVIEREMANSAYGVVRGVTLPSFLQVMEWEHKNLSIRVESPRGWGRLHLLQGRLVGAYADPSGLEGEDAALEIMSWDAVSLRIERSYHNGRGGEMRSLGHLLMDAMKKKDEDAKQETAALAGDLLLYDDPSDLLPPAEIESSLLDLLDEYSGARPAGEAAPRPTPPRDPTEAFGDADDHLLIYEPVVPASPPAPLPRGPVRSNVRETLGSAVAGIGGALAAALVDYDLGLVLETQGGGLDFGAAAAANTEIVRAKLRTLAPLGAGGGLEDILITLRHQYHVISLIPDRPLFLYLVLAREGANLALARHQLRALGAALTVA